MVLVALGVGLLAGMAVAVYMAATGATIARTPASPNFRPRRRGRARLLDRELPARSVLVIYFGYTTCLRACPIALDNIAAAMDRLGTEGAAVRPVFIDMDPDRAASVSLPLYMQTFGPAFLGLTGSPEAVAQAARASMSRSNAWSSAPIRPTMR